MTTELERRLTEAFHEDAQNARLVNPDGPAAGELYAPAEPPRSHTGRWLAAAAVVVLVVAAIALLRNAGDDSDGPVDVVPTTTTVPMTDTPSTGSIVTADGHGWPEGAAAPGGPEGEYSWSDFDPATGSFLYVEFLSSRVWVLSEDGDEEAEADLQCNFGGCAGGTVFGPGPDEVTGVVRDETCSGPDDCDHGPVLPERVQIVSWDGTVRDKVDISAAFTRDGNGTAERHLGAPAGSPAGSRLAVSTEPGGTEPAEGCDPVRDECVAEVWIFDRDGGEPQLVHTATSAHPADPE